MPRRGAFVARLERADIVDHYRIFGLVAGLAASRAATVADRRRARSSSREVHESFVAATDADAQASWNHEFHRRINRAGGSRRLVSVLALLSRSLPVRYFEFVPGWAEASARHHDRILAALEQRDAHEAQRIMEHHVAESGELAVEILQEMGYWDRERGRRRERIRVPHESHRHQFGTARGELLMSFFGSTAIVTGGASGIGLAISERLADDGAKVAIFDLDAEQAEHAVKEITRRGRRSRSHARSTSPTVPRSTPRSTQGA